MASHVDLREKLLQFYLFSIALQKNVLKFFLELCQRARETTCNRSKPSRREFTALGGNWEVRVRVLPEYPEKPASRARLGPALWVTGLAPGRTPTDRETRWRGQWCAR